MTTTKLSGRLTEDAVRQIRARIAEGETYQSIAALFGVAIGTIYNIAKKRTWAHLK